MRKYLDVSTTATRFRLISFVEAITWGLLLIGMAVKYGADIDSATMVPGALHGAAFVIYLILGALAAWEFKWSLKVMFFAVVASIVPFATIAFEKWAVNNGQLGELSADQALAKA